MLIHPPKVTFKELNKRWALLRRTILSQSLQVQAKKRGGIMPPKKKEAEGPGPLLGRFGTSLKCGIVGLPNVGYVWH